MAANGKAISLAFISSGSGRNRLTGITTLSTVGEVKTQIRNVLSLELTAALRIKSGYPPVLLPASDGDLIKDTALRSGDMLTVEQVDSGKGSRGSGNASVSSGAQLNGHSADQTSRHQVPAPRQFERKEVPADNSCLFASILFCMGERATSESVDKLRSVAAERVVAEKDTFNEAILGRPPAEYAAWIIDGDHWGGAIELNILSRHYQVEMCVCDIRDERVQIFGEEFAFEKRIFLAYDGIHYDPLRMATDGSRSDVRQFDSSDFEAQSLALSFAETAHKQREFTDIQKFDIRCLTCQTPFKGSLAATKHAETTGHTNFGEV